MHKCKKWRKSITDFLINKLGGVTQEAHEAGLLERVPIHIDRRSMQTCDIIAEGKWQADQALTQYAKKMLAEAVGRHLMEEGFLHFDVSEAYEPNAPVDIKCVRATVRAVAPTSQGCGNKAEGFFIDDAGGYPY